MAFVAAEGAKDWPQALKRIDYFGEDFGRSRYCSVRWVAMPCVPRAPAIAAVDGVRYILAVGDTQGTVETSEYPLIYASPHGHFSITDARPAAGGPESLKSRGEGRNGTRVTRI